MYTVGLAKKTKCQYNVKLPNLVHLGLKFVWTVGRLCGAERERERWRDGEIKERSVVTISAPHLYQQFLDGGSFRNVLLDTGSPMQ